MPTAKQMMEAEDVYLLTPSIMNPHCDVYTTNKANMLDWEENMIQWKDRVRILLSEIQEDVAMTASVLVLSTEARAINTVLERNGVTYDEEGQPCWQPFPRVANKVLSVLASMSPTLDDQTLYGRLSARTALGNFKASICSTNALGGKHLIDDDSSSQPLTGDDMGESDLDKDDDQTLNHL
jgi:hypothetical protein